MIQKANLKVTIIQEGLKMQTKCLENLFSEIVEKFQNFDNDMDIQVQEAFRTAKRHEQKRISPITHHS